MEFLLTKMRRLYMSSRLCGGRGRFGHGEFEMSLRYPAAGVMYIVIYAGVWERSLG